VGTTKQSRTPGRPRQFDPLQAVELRSTFFTRGYDAVSVADLTKRSASIRPASTPRLAASSAFITACWIAIAAPGRFPAELLRDDRPVVQCLMSVLHEAARRYVADPTAAGCMVLEGIHCNDRPAREAASELPHTARKTVFGPISPGAIRRTPSG
jgi:TetR/AcrR family transcriptional repressor for divergent bdcA